MEIKKLTESDYDALLALNQELDAVHWQARPDYFLPRSSEQTYPRDAFLHNLDHPGVLELGAFADGQLVGFVRASLWEESGMVKGVKTVCLDNLYVMPEHRRKGAAKGLFAAVEAWAKEQGAVRLDLHVWGFNQSALALYQAMGMTPQRYVLEKKL